jgi:hypothetical protein
VILISARQSGTRLGRPRVNAMARQRFFAARRGSRQARPMPPRQASAALRRRTITRTASHHRLLSLGSWIGAAVTVLSSRTTLPFSSFSCRAPKSSVRLIAAQVSARLALIVLCSTDCFGLQAHGSRANARNDAESSRGKASS